MTCKEFHELSIQEKTKYIGLLVHAVQNDTKSYAYGLAIIDEANQKGLFNNVIINPPNGG